MSDIESKKFVGCLFNGWEDRWGLRGDPFLWEELSKFLAKEPLPASVSQLMALIEKAFFQLVGSQLSDPSPSIYVDRYNHGGLSGGHVCGEFWRDKVLPELHRRYLAVKYADSTKSPRMIDKPCRYESYPGGCRYGASCRFHHAKPVSQQSFSSRLNQNSGTVAQKSVSVSFAPKTIPGTASAAPFGMSNFPMNTPPMAGSPRSVFDTLSLDHDSGKGKVSMVHPPVEQVPLDYNPAGFMTFHLSGEPNPFQTNAAHFIRGSCIAGDVPVTHLN